MTGPILTFNVMILLFEPCISLCERIGIIPTSSDNSPVWTDGILFSLPLGMDNRRNDGDDETPNFFSKFLN